MTQQLQDLDDKIIRQIEYYFGDINLNKDKFMKEEIQKDSGWVSLETLIKFNRLKQLTTDFKIICEALKKSQSNLLEIDEANSRIRRARALPENLGEFETNLKQNTVYVKGFSTNLSLDDLYAFFEKHGKVLQVFMRRFPTTKQFKGSAFVTFETNEQMKSFLAQESPKYEDSVLTLESQEDYIKRKGPQIESIKEAKKKKEQQKEQKLKQKQEAEEAYLKEQQVLGALLHLKGLNDKASRENIKAFFEPFATVKYVDYSKGQTEGYVRFAETDNAKLALEKAGEVAIGGSKVEARVLEGEEENDYWKTLIRNLADRKSKGKNNNNRRRNNNRNQNKNGRKRSLENEDDNDDDNDGNENGEASAENDCESTAKKVKV